MTQTQTDERGRRVIDTRVSGYRFEVFETTGEDNDGYAYVGYCDGERSVVATRADIAARGLARKHVRTPEEKAQDQGNVVSLCDARRRRASGETLH